MHKTLKRGSLQGIIKLAGLTRDDFFDLYDPKRSRRKKKEKEKIQIQ